MENPLYLSAGSQLLVNGATYFLEAHSGAWGSACGHHGTQGTTPGDSGLQTNTANCTSFLEMVSVFPFLTCKRDLPPSKSCLVFMLGTKLHLWPFAPHPLSEQRFWLHASSNGQTEILKIKLKLYCQHLCILS